MQVRRIVRVTDQFPANLLDERRPSPSRPSTLGDGGSADLLLHLLGGVQNQPDRMHVRSRTFMHASVTPMFSFCA